MVTHISACCVSQVLGWHRCGLHLVDHKSSNNGITTGEYSKSGSHCWIIRVLNLGTVLHFDSVAAIADTYLVFTLGATITSQGELSHILPGQCTEGQQKWLNLVFLLLCYVCFIKTIITALISLLTLEFIILYVHIITFSLCSVIKCLYTVVLVSVYCIICWCVYMCVYSGGTNSQFLLI